MTRSRRLGVTKFGVQGVNPLLTLRRLTADLQKLAHTALAFIGQQQAFKKIGFLNQTLVPGPFDIIHAFFRNTHRMR